MQVKADAVPMITLGSERDPNASIGVIEIPALWSMQNSMMNALQVAMVHGAEIRCKNPDHYGFLSLSASGSMDTGYLVQYQIVVQGEETSAAVHRNTAAAAMRTLLSFAPNSNIFDYEAI